MTPINEVPPTHPITSHLTLVMMTGGRKAFIPGQNLVTPINEVPPTHPITSHLTLVMMTGVEKHSSTYSYTPVCAPNGGTHVTRTMRCKAA
jgi:hypothetical protein